MKSYTHDYSLPGEVRSLLGEALRELRCDDQAEAEKLLQKAVCALDEYLNNDNMVEEEEGGGWVKVDTLSTIPEVAIVIMTRGNDLAHVISCGTLTRSFEMSKTKRHSSILKGIAHLEAKGYTINTDTPWL